MEECSSDYQRWTKLPFLKSGDDDGNATLFELRPSLSSVSHCTSSAWRVWLTNGSNWVSLCCYISNTLEGEKDTPQYFFLALLFSLSLSQSKKKWWELISGSSSITISSPCVIRWALINPVFFNEIIVTLFLCDTVEDFRFWGLVWFFWFFQ